jgi:hypothetical protein
MALSVLRFAASDYPFEKGKMLEDTKGAIRSYKSKDRQYNGQMKKDKWTNNDLQNTTQKTKI